MKRICGGMTATLAATLGLAALARTTPETSRLFEKRIDPVSGVVSYALTGGERENRQHLYFTTKSMTDDGRFLIFNKSLNERFSTNETFMTRQKAIVDFEKDEIIDLPGAMGMVPFVETKENYLITTDDRGFIRYNLWDPTHPIRLCDFPEELRKLGKPDYWADHPTLTKDRKKVFLDTCFLTPGATNCVQGLLDLETGKFEEWTRTDFICDHGQLCPARDDLALCAWELCWDVPKEKLGFYPRMWLMSAEGKKTPVKSELNDFATHEIWDEDGEGFTWCGDGNARGGIFHCDLATGRQECLCADPLALHCRVTADRRYLVYDCPEDAWWRGCRWSVRFHDRKTKRTIDVFSPRAALNPRDRQSHLHPDPHPQFVCRERYIVSTACNAAGNMELYVTPVEQLKLETNMTDDRLLSDWPAGCDPVTVNRKITEQFLAADPLAYKPVGSDIEKHIPEGYGWNQWLVYPTVSLWIHALDNARDFGEPDLERRLVAKLEPLMTTCVTLTNLYFHVDANVVGALPLAVARLTGDARMREVGLRFADFQWKRPDESDLQAIRDYSSLEEARAWWAQGYTGETRLWMDDMYMINQLQTEAYRLTGDRKYLERAAQETCLYLDRLQLENGLFNHAPDVPYVWGRGAGWMAGAMPLVLRFLEPVPPSNPPQEKILVGYRKMMRALLAYQRADGLWGQLADDPTSWGETSGSAMFAYAIAAGIRYGWLDRATYAPALRRAWIALCNRLDAHGNLADVCIGTNKKNDRQHYLDRARINGDPHGQAPMLWTAGMLQALPLVIQ